LVALQMGIFTRGVTIYKRSICACGRGKSEGFRETEELQPGENAFVFTADRDSLTCGWEGKVHIPKKTSSTDTIYVLRGERNICEEGQLIKTGGLNSV